MDLLRLNTLRDTKTAILIPKRYDEHPPVLLIWECPPPPPSRDTDRNRSQSVFLDYSIHDIFFYKILRSDLEDIRKEIEKVEEHIQTGPLKTKSELSVKVHVT